MTLPDVSLAPLPAALAALLDDLERTHHGARLLTYDSGAPARVARLAGEGDDREALLDESFGVKTYPATDVGFVPVRERDVERFTLGARPAMDPVKSENRLKKALRKPDDASASVPSVRALSETSDESEPGRRGIFGRRR